MTIDRRVSLHDRSDRPDHLADTSPTPAHRRRPRRRPTWRPPRSADSNVASIVVGLVAPRRSGSWYFLDADARDPTMPRHRLGRRLAGPAHRHRRRWSSSAAATGREPVTEPAARPPATRRDPRARRLAATGRGPLRRGPPDRGDGRGAALALWRATREALYRDHPRRPSRSTERAAFRARHFDHDPTPRGSRSPSSEPRRGRATDPHDEADRFDAAARGAGSCRSAPAGRWLHPDRSRRDPVRGGAAASSASSGWPATRAACSSRSATRRTAPRRTAPAATCVDAAKSRRPGRRPGARHARPRLQLRLPAVVRVRPEWACPLAPPENRLDIPSPGRRADRLTERRAPGRPACGTTVRGGLDRWRLHRRGRTGLTIGGRRRRGRRSRPGVCACESAGGVTCASSSGRSAARAPPLVA